MTHSHLMTQWLICCGVTRYTVALAMCGAGAICLKTVARSSLASVPWCQSLSVINLRIWAASPYLLHSINLILFTVLLVHLILCISPHHSHHLRSHHLSLPLPFTPDLKLISFTNPFLHSHSFPSGLPSRINLYWIKGALALFVLVSGYVC